MAKAGGERKKGARGRISVLEKVKIRDEAGPSLASKKGKRGRPSSGLTEQDREKRHNEGCQESKKDESLRLHNIEEVTIAKHVNQDAMPMDDFIEMDDLTSFYTGKMPMDDFIEMDDLTSFNTGKMPMDDFIEMDDLTSFNTKKMPIDDFIEMDDLTSFNTKKMPMDDFIEMDDLTSFNTKKMPVDDFIEMDDFTSFSTKMFGSLFDGQSPTLGGEEAVTNESPHQYKFGSFFDGQSPALGRKEAAMNEPPVQYEEVG